MRLNYIFLIGIIAVVTIIGSTAQAAPSPTLSIDSVGEDVVILQQKLQDIGYSITEVDGIFGNETERAVAAFQHDNQISVTGIVTNVTWRALQKAKPVKGRTLETADVKVNTLKKGNLVAFGKTFINRQQGLDIIATGKKYIGVPYVFGGTTPKGFDCSGFLQYVFKENGFIVPRLADEQYQLGKAVKTKELTAGDLVFFTTYEAGASHCGIYLGQGQFLHTSSSRGVRIDLLNNVYWAPRFYGAKKIVEV